MTPVRRTVEDALAELARRFERAGLARPRREAQVIVGHVAGLDRAGLLGGRDRLLSPAERARIRALGARRAAHEPMAYLLGHREFWSLELRVNAETLIPRPDSEAVIEAALEAVGDRAAPLRLLDLGAGSGCLLLALLSELPRAWGVGVDIRPGACVLAAANARALGLAARARFVVGDWGGALEGEFDVIVANPPYVALAEASRLAPEIIAFEPHEAVFAGTDGLAGFRAIGPAIRRLLAPGGSAVVEIGAGQEAAATALFRARGLAVVGARRDLAGRRRCLVLRRARADARPGVKKGCKLGAGG